MQFTGLYHLATVTHFCSKRIFCLKERLLMGICQVSPFFLSFVSRRLLMGICQVSHFSSSHFLPRGDFWWELVRFPLLFSLLRLLMGRHLRLRSVYPTLLLLVWKCWVIFENIWSEKNYRNIWRKKYQPTPTSSSSSPSSKEFPAEAEPDGQLDTDFLDNLLSL